MKSESEFVAMADALAASDGYPERDKLPAGKSLAYYQKAASVIRHLAKDSGKETQEETWMDTVLQTAQQNVIRTFNEMGLCRNARWFKKYMDLLDEVDEHTPEDSQLMNLLGRSFTVTRGHLDDGNPTTTVHDYCASEVIMYFPFLSELVWMNITHPEGNFSAEWGSLESFTRVELKPL